MKTLFRGFCFHLQLVLVVSLYIILMLFVRQALIFLLC